MICPTCSRDVAILICDPVSHEPLCCCYCIACDIPGLPTDRLVEAKLRSPNMQIMMDLIAEVLNGKEELKGGAHPAWDNYFLIMCEFGLRRMEDTNYTINKDYFERLYENVKKDYLMRTEK